jgi:hypothetical protein
MKENFHIMFAMAVLICVLGLPFMGMAWQYSTKGRPWLLFVINLFLTLIFGILWAIT